MRDALTFRARRACLAIAVSLTVISACCTTASAAEAENEQQMIAEAVTLLNAQQTAKAIEKLQPLQKSRDIYVRAAAQYYAGHCLLRQKKNDQAAQLWLSITAPTHRQSNGAHWYHAGRLEVAKLAMAGKIFKLKKEQCQPAAIKVLEEVLNAPPFAAIQAQAALELGAIARQRKQHGFAQQYYQFVIDLLDALEPNAEQPILTENKAELLTQLQKQLATYEKAAKVAEKNAKDAAAEAALPEEIRNVKAALAQAKEAGAKGNVESAIAVLRAVIATKPEQAQMDEARFYLGRYLLDSGEKPQAVREWERLLQDEPTGVHSPQILLDMVDQELFHEFHVPRTKVWLETFEKTFQLAVKESQPATEELPMNTKEAAPQKEAEQQAPPNLDKNITEDLSESLLVKETFESLPVDWQHAYRALVHRRGLVAWLEEDAEKGADLLELSRKFNPKEKPEGFKDSNVFAGVSVEPTIAVLRGGPYGDARQKLPLTADRPEVAVALRLGELAMAIQKYEEARTFFDAVAMEKSPLRPTPEQEGYALLRAGLCSHWLQDREAVKRYSTAIATRRRLVNTVAVARAYKREAVLAYSVDKNPERALTLMREVYTRFPHTDEAIDAMFFTGVIYEWEGQREKAVQSYLAALKEYPDHKGMQTAVKNRFLELKIPLPEELQEANQGEVK